MERSTNCDKSVEVSQNGEKEPQREQAREPQKEQPEKAGKIISTTSVKLSGENENGEAMKSYREAVEQHIKEYLLHQPQSRQFRSREALTEAVKKTFEGVDSAQPAAAVLQTARRTSIAADSRRR